MVFFYPTKKNLVYVTAFHQKKIFKHEPNSHKSITFTVTVTIPTWEPPFVLRIQIELIQPRLKNYQWNNTTSLHVFPKTLKK